MNNANNSSAPGGALVDRLKAAGWVLGPDGSLSHPSHEKNTMVGRVCHAQPEQSSRKALDKSAPAKTARKGLPAKSDQPLISIRIVRCATRPLDLDNFAGGCKPLIDQLRYAKLIPDDDPSSISVTFEQRSVKRADAGTLVEIENIQPITYPDGYAGSR
jgi:hypothetical protein